MDPQSPCQIPSPLTTAKVGCLVRSLLTVEGPGSQLPCEQGTEAVKGELSVVGEKGHREQEDHLLLVPEKDRGFICSQVSAAG